MHLHNDPLKFLQDHLPPSYVQKVIERLGLPADKKLKSLIRNIKYGKKTDDTVMLAMVEVAEEHKKAKEKIDKIVNS